MTPQDFLNFVFEYKADDEVLSVSKYIEFSDGGSSFINATIKDAEFLSWCSDPEKRAEPWYFCVSTVDGERNENGRVLRRKANLKRYYCLVLDDIGTKAKEPPVEPAWKMESSKGNYQWGYLLEPDDDWELYDNLLVWAAESGWSDKNAGGCYRVMRLPFSCNVKDGRDSWLSKYTDGNNKEWSLKDLAAALGATAKDLEAITTKKEIVRTQNSDVSKYGNTQPDIVIDALRFIDASQRTICVDIGMALKYWQETQYHVSFDQVFEIFDTWAKSAEGYENEDNFAWFRDFKPAGLIDLGTLFYHAKEGGWSREVFKSEKLDAVISERVDSGTSLVCQQIQARLFNELLDMGYPSDAVPLNDAALVASEKRCFVDATGKYFWINSEGVSAPLLKTTLVEQMDEAFGSIVDKSLMWGYIEDKRKAGDEEFEGTALTKFIKETFRVVMNGFWAVVTNEKVCVDKQLQVDMFISEVEVSFDATRTTISIPFGGLSGVVGDELDTAIVDDYKEHNPDFDDIIDFIGYSRFAGNRKNCYLWMHCPSNWGKDFLTYGVFGRLGLMLDVSVKDIERAFEGAPVGISAAEMLHQWMLVVDEFKTVKSEIKLLDDKLMASPKGQMRFAAPLYAKVFTSAESVAAMAGEAGVETQFANRFSYISGSGRLSDRSLHGVDQDRYTGACREYARLRLEALVARMRGVGRVESLRLSAEWLQDWHRERGIANFYDDLDDTVRSEVLEIADVVRQFGRGCNALGIDPESMGAGNNVEVRGLPDAILRVLVQNIRRCSWKDVDGFVLAKPSKLVSEWIRAEYSGSQFGKMIMKSTQICELLDAELFPDRGGRVTGLTIKGSMKTSKGVFFSLLNEK